MERVDYEKIVIQDLINIYKRDELDLNPWYQRRSVWTVPQKSYLINTMFERKPVPTCYIRHKIDLEREKSVKEVVDGQQRIRAILEYNENKYSARHPNYKKHVKISDITATERKRFLTTSLSIGYLIEAEDADVIDIFGRLNSVSKTLNSQEKRNAKYSGEMKQFCLKEAASRVALWRSLSIFTANDIARMSEIQFLSEVVQNLVKGLTDYSAKRLDDFYEEYEEDFPEMHSIIDRVEKIIGKVASLKEETIRDTIFSRPPLFFSLLIALDENNCRISNKSLSETLYKIDEIFNAGIPISEHRKEDAEFINACTASTQRIKSRKIRHDYLINQF